MWQHLRLAVRISLRNPGLTCAIIASAAVGIGANTAIFSVVKGLLLEQLRVREPARLVSFHQGGDAASISYPDYLDYSAQTRSFEGISACFPVLPASLGTTGGPEHLWGQLVTPNYFSVVGAEPPVGRGFLADEKTSHVVVLSDSLWRRDLGADPSIVGKPVLLSGATYTVVGVAPPDFHGVVRGLRPDFWVPLGLYAQVLPLFARDGKLEENREYPWLFINARLRVGVSHDAAAAEVRAIATQLNGLYRTKWKRDLRLVEASTLPMGLGMVKVLLKTLMGVSALVLLVACVNITNLLLAHSTARLREMGIRVAVGATRMQIIRQLLAESMFLSALGALVGTALAIAGTRALSRLQMASPIPVSVDLSLDWRVLLFTFALSAATGILFGFAPAVRATRPDPIALLRSDGSSFVAFRSFGFRNILVVAQLALSLILLVGAGLFLRSLQVASSIPLGLRADNVLTLAFDPRATGYTNERSVVLFHQVEDRLRALPGVKDSALVDTLPLSILPHRVGVNLPGKPMMLADIYGITPHYFQTMGIDLLRGRDFNDRLRSSRPAAVINHTIAARLFGNENPVGQMLLMEGGGREIIGVVRDTKSMSLGEENQPQIYLSLHDDYNLFWGFFGVQAVVRTQEDPTALVAPVRQQFRDLDPALAIYNVSTMRGQVEAAMLMPRVCGTLFGVFGGTGLVLATVGLYGLMNYSVRRRTREIGIRMAVGATPKRVLSMVLRYGFTLAIIGIVIGLVLAFMMSSVLRAFLYGTGAHDPVTFVCVPGFLLAVAGLATLVPGLRAARLDVMRSIRHE